MLPTSGLSSASGSKLVFFFFFFFLVRSKVGSSSVILALFTTLQQTNKVSGISILLNPEYSFISPETFQVANYSNDGSEKFRSHHIHSFCLSLLFITVFTWSQRTSGAPWWVRAWCRFGADGWCSIFTRHQSLHQINDSIEAKVLLTLPLQSNKDLKNL